MRRTTCFEAWRLCRHQTFLTATLVIRKLRPLRKGLTEAIESFTASILNGERDLALADPKNREGAFNHLVSFLMSFASRSGTRERPAPLYNQLRSLHRSRCRRGRIADD